jgi:hypothetical protein
MRPLLALLAIAACSKGSASAPPPEPAPAQAVSPLSLEVRIDGTATKWTEASFEHVPRIEGKASSGETRDTWSLRDFAHAAAGDHARVTAVIGDVRKEIDEAAWSDPARTPIIHRTRRGWLKFRWADQTGKWGDAEVKDVSALEIVR